MLISYAYVWQCCTRSQGITLHRLPHIQLVANCLATCAMYYIHYPGTFVHVVIGTGPHVHNLLFLVLLQFHHKGEWPARTLGHYAMKHSVVIAVVVID